VRWVSGLNQRFAKPSYSERGTEGSNPSLTAEELEWVFEREFDTIKRKRKPKLTLFRDVAQPGSAPVLGTGGPRFESWYPDIKSESAMIRSFFLSKIAAAVAHPAVQREISMNVI
jgi:hypothetical protein